MSSPSPHEHSRQIMRMLRGYREASVLITFAELGIGDALAGGALTPAEIARAVDADPAATGRFLRAAEELGLVTVEAGRYRLTSLASGTLRSDGAASLVNFLRREATFYRRWSRLTEAVRSGRRPEANARDEEQPGWVRTFTLALFETSRLAAEDVARALAPLIHSLPRPASVIDVGGGHGGYSLALARAFPELRAVVFDLPPVIEITREIIAQAGLADRVATRAGDFHVDPLGTDYDLALLFGVLPGEDEARAVRLLSIVRAALRPGGYLVIRGQAGRQDRSSAASGALVDLHMLLSTERGGAHQPADIAGWMRRAGLTVERPIDLGERASGELLVGRVPAPDHQLSGLGGASGSRRDQ